MNNYFKRNIAFTSLFILSLLVIGGCSSDDNKIDLDDEGTIIGNSSITMKIDGEIWSTQYAVLTTVKDDEENEDVHIVIITSREDSNEETKETLHINILLDASKFSNPKGTYPFHAEESEATPINHAQADYIDLNNSITYTSGNPLDYGVSTGDFKVTDYKIGEQVLGAGEGYLKLSGTFNMDMYTAYPDSEGEYDKVEIREGAFNVEHGFLMD